MAGGSFRLWQATESQLDNGWPTTWYIAPSYKLWAWGKNTTGQLGDGTTVNRSSPIQVGALTNWLSISAGYSHSLAIKMDNTLWAWGNGGPLGDATIISKSSPIQVGSLTNWKLVKTGNNHSIAIKTDGTLWTWGANSYGQLGLGSSTDTSSPVQVGLLTDWLSIATGENHTIATKINGTVWSWGRNEFLVSHKNRWTTARCAQTMSCLPLRQS